MSHITVELHEKYKGEKIPDSDHAVVHEEMSHIGFFQTAIQDGVVHHLPRGCYFNEAGSNTEARQAQMNLESRLGRRVRLEVTIGPSSGFGLDPEVTHPFSSLGMLLSTPSSIPGFSALESRTKVGTEENLYGSLLGFGGRLK